MVVENARILGFDTCGTPHYAHDVDPCLAYTTPDTLPETEPRSSAMSKGQVHLVVRPLSRLHLRSTHSLFIQRLLIGAGKASPSPPVGPALGARGVKSMDFCKEFNARTAHIEPGVPIPTMIRVQPDRSFTFVTKTPPTTYLLKQVAGLEKGPARPGHEILGTVSLKHVYEITKIKARDDHLKHLKLESIASTVIGTARTLGLQVVP